MHGDAMKRNSPANRRLLACLGDPSRFRVVSTLLASPYCVSDLAGRIGLSQSCTTRHLQSLRRVGMVCAARQGKRVVYSLCLDDPRVVLLVQWALAETPRVRSAAAAGSPALRRDLSEGPARGRPSPEESPRELGSDQSPGGASGYDGSRESGGASSAGSEDPAPASAEAPSVENDLEDYLL